jgi:hypothetical protein
MGIGFWRGWNSGTKRPHRAPARKTSRLRLESLEDRITPSVSIQFDFSRDTSGFFASNPSAKAELIQAAADLTSRLNDSLSAIIPSGGDTWTLTSFEPNNPGVDFTVSNRSIAANTILVYAGGSANLNGALGIGGPGGWGVAGDPTWQNTVAARGQSGALLASPTDFGPWGGTVTFDSTYPDWYFGSSPTGMTFQQVDFYSVAQHELGHVLGFGTADSWHRDVSGSFFVGPNSVKEFGKNVPLDAAGNAAAHWANNTVDRGQHADMDPVAENGVRTAFTPLDYAGLQDLGWQITPMTPTMLAPSGMTPTTTPTFTWTTVSTAASYTLEIDDANLNPVFTQSGITTTTFSLTALTALSDQAMYSAKVEAFDGSGATNGFSKSLSFSVKVPQATTLPFSDSFATPAFDGGLSPQWTVAVGGYQLNTSSQAVANVTGANLAVVNTVPVGDVTVSAGITSIPSTTMGGLVARYQGTGDKNMYMAGVRNTSGVFTAEIWKNVNGTWTKLTTVTLTHAQFSGMGTMRFDVIGTNLRLFVNGTVVASAVDATFATGTVGIRGAKGAKFSNYNADAVTLQPTTLAFPDSFAPIIDNQLAPNWINQVGNFNLQLFGVIPVAAAGLTGVNMAVLDGVNSGDVSISATVNSLASGLMAGLVARYQGIGDKNMYMAGVRNTSGVFTAEVWKNVKGTWTRLTTVTLSHAQFSGTGTLRFDAVGSSLRLFVNGTVVASAADATFATGSVGIRGGKGVKFSNFNAADVTRQTAPLPFSDSFGPTADNQLAPTWTDQIGNFNTIAGNQVAAAGLTGPNVAVVNGISTASVSLLADVSNIASGTMGSLVARYQGIGDKNMYMAGVRNTNGVYTAEIWKNVNGIWTKLKTKTLTAAQFNGSGTLEFDLSGSTLNLLVNGTLMASTMDNTFATGAVGIRGLKGDRFSNFSAA